MKSPIEALLDTVTWQPLLHDKLATEREELYATHKGILKVGNVQLEVFQLNDGRRVIEQKSLLRFLSMEVK